MNKPSTTTGTDWNALDNSSFRATVREFFETRYPKDLRYPKRRLRWAEIRDWYLTLSQKGWVAPSWPSSTIRSRSPQKSTSCCVPPPRC